MTSTSVNVPVNEKIKEQDINNKLQVYGIYSAFANGKAPSNKQIDIALNSFLESKVLGSPSNNLSEEGRKLVADTRDVVEQAKLLLLSKNEGNLIQDFIWQTQQISGGDATTPNAPVSGDQAKRHGNEALDGLRTLGTLLVSNGQFRKLLSDAQILLRDIVGDAASKTAGKVNPSEQQLNQLDEPAADNTWHDVPDMSSGNIKGQLKSRWDEQKPFSKGDLQEAAGDASQAAHPSGSRDPTDNARLGAQQQQQYGDNSVDARHGLSQGLDTLHAKAQQNVPEDTKDTGREYKDRTQDYIKRKVPKERREQTIFRLKKMIVEIQGHQDYQRAIETLLNLAEQYAGHTKNLAGQSTGAVKGAHSDDSLKTAEADLKTIIERFANNTSTDDLFDSIDQIYRDADQDPELKKWFRTVDAYIRKCLQEQGFIMQDAANDEYNRIEEHGRYLLRDKYRGHTDRILDEFKFLGNQFDADPQNQRFRSSLEKLFLDLGNDENGKTTFKPHLVKDLRDVILPALFTNIRYVPIPRIEYSDPMVDMVVENLVIESDNLAPNVLEFSTDNYWKWGRKQITSKNKNKVMLAVSGVQLDLRDVAFYMKKKQGFPSIQDTGVIDIFMGGTGLSFKIAAETADKTDRHHFFKINKVDVDVKNVKIKIKKSNHKLLLAIGKPILLKVLRPALQKIIEKQIRDNAAKLDEIAWRINKEAEKAKEEARRNPDPDHLENMYQRYLSAAKNELSKGEEKAQKAKEKTEDKHANVAITQHDSMFPNIKLPGGISTKATEYKDLARKGDKWESPIFSIGSAKESTNIPKNPEIKRKHHQTATPNNIQAMNNQGYGAATGAGLGAAGAGYGATGAGGYGATGAHPSLGQSSGLTGQGYGAPGLAGQGAPGAGVNAAYPTGPLSSGTGAGSNLGAQMDGAFNGGPVGGPVGGYTNGNAAPVNGAGKPAHATTLYDQNPVLTGQV